MANYKVTDTQLSSIADAIRLKAGISDSLVFPSGFVSAISSISAGVLGSKMITSNGSYSAADDNLDGFDNVVVDVTPSLMSLSVSANGSYTPSSGYDGFSQVTVNVESGGGDDKYLIAIGVASGSITDNELSAIPAQTFRGRSMLSAFSAGECMTIGNYAFFGCSALSYVSIPKCTEIPLYAFEGCKELTEVEFPSCVSIYGRGFALCSGLSRASFPLCENIANDAFRECTSLTDIYIPQVSQLGSYCFYSCTALSVISLPNCKIVSNYTFNSCKALETLILLSSSVAVLNHSNAFQYTPMSLSSYLGRFGSIYVPASLVDSYKAATNWSRYAARITAYEE